MASKTLKPANKCKSLRGFFTSPRKWIQGSYEQDNQRQCCLMGALDAIYTGDKYEKVQDRLEDSIQRFYSRKAKKSAPNTDIVSFNDKNGRKFEHIRWVIEDARA